MRTGRLSIARGNQLERSLVVEPPAEPPISALEFAEPAWSPEHFKPLEERINALERLAKLHQQGLLSSDEYAAEKALLRWPSEIVSPDAGAPTAGPSLLGRLIRWPVLAIGLAAGLALTATSQPEISRGLFDQTLHLIGA